MHYLDVWSKDTSAAPGMVFWNKKGRRAHMIEVIEGYAGRQFYVPMCLCGKKLNPITDLVSGNKVTILEINAPRPQQG